VLACVVEAEEVGFLSGAELGLLPAEPTFGAGDLHPFAGAHAGEVGLELGHHGQHVEQEPADGVGGVVDGAAEVELDLASGELVGDGPASGRDRASRSSLVTTRVSPVRQAAKACRRPGRSRLVPVRPWST